MKLFINRTVEVVKIVLSMEGGLVTLILGLILVVLFTDHVPEPLRNRAAAHAVATASGLGLFTSGYIRDVPLLIALGLVVAVVGVSLVLVPRPAQPET